MLIMTKTILYFSNWPNAQKQKLEIVISRQLITAAKELIQVLVQHVKIYIGFGLYLQML